MKIQIKTMKKKHRGEKNVESATTSIQVCIYELEM